MPIVDTTNMTLEEVKALYEEEATNHDKDIEESNAKIEELTKSKTDLEESYKKKEEETNKTLAKLRIEALKTPKEKEEKKEKEEEETPNSIESLAKYMIKNRK